LVPDEVADLTAGVANRSMLGKRVDLLGCDEIGVVVRRFFVNLMQSFSVSKLQVAFLDNIRQFGWVLGGVSKVNLRRS
jgi:hypothetical protein